MLHSPAKTIALWSIWPKVLCARPWTIYVYICRNIDSYNMCAVPSIYSNSTFYYLQLPQLRSLPISFCWVRKKSRRRIALNHEDYGSTSVQARSISALLLQITRTTDCQVLASSLEVPRPTKHALSLSQTRTSQPDQ